MADWLTAMKELRDGKVHPVYTLIGPEYTLMNRFISALADVVSRTAPQGEFTGDFGAESVSIDKHSFEEEGCGEAIFSCQSFSLFSTRSIVILHNCTALTASPKVKHDVSELESYLQAPVLEKILVITVQADKVDERKKITKALKKYGVIECTTPKDDGAIKLLNQFIKDNGIQIATNAMQELWRRCSSIAQAETELRKLWAYVDERQIELQHVQELVASPIEDNVFQWIDCVVTGKLDKAFQTLQDIQMSGYDVFGLLSLIARQIRIMWFARAFTEKGYSQQQIATRVGGHPYAIRVASEQARYISLDCLETLMTIVADAEFSVKSGRKDMKHALDWVVLACSAAVKQRMAWAQ